MRNTLQTHTSTPQLLSVPVSGLINLVALLAFFPFIVLIPGMGAEVQPYCYLVAIFIIIACGTRLPVFLYLFLAFLFGYFIYYLLTAYFSFSLSFKSVPHIIIFAGPPLFFYVLYLYRHFIKWHWIHWAYYIWIFVGTVQQLFPALLEKTGVNAILNVLIPRYSGERLAEVSRGVTSLSNEPSYAAILLFAAFTVIIYRYVKKEFGKGRLIAEFAVYVWSVLINASVTGFMLLFVFILAFFYYKKMLLSFALFCFVGGMVLFNIQTETRALQVLQELPQLLEANEYSLYEIMVGPMGSIREFSTLVALKSSLFNVWGNGYYSSLNYFITIARDLGFDLNKIIFFKYNIVTGYVNMKPYGYGSLVLFELGIVPFLLINVLLVKIIYNHVLSRGPYYRLGIFLAIHAVVFLNFNTVASLPCYWFELLAALQIIKYKATAVPHTSANDHSQLSTI